MQGKMDEIKEKLESRINTSSVSEEKKDRMRRTLQAIFKSPSGRVYFEKQPSYQKYLTIRKAETGDYDLCMVDRMINTLSGAEEGSRYYFPPLSALIELVHGQRDVIESEIMDIERYQKIINAENSYQQTRQITTEPITQSVSRPKGESANATINQPINYRELYRKNMVNAIQGNKLFSGPQKYRATSVLAAIYSSPNGKICVNRGSNYTETIELRDNGREARCYVVTTIYDEYSGARIDRRIEPISAKGLIEYVEKNRIVIDKEMRKGKKESQMNIQEKEDR